MAETSEQPIYLDAAEAAEKRAEKVWRLNAIEVPTIRLVWFSFLLLPVALFNRLVLGVTEWGSFLTVAVILETYCLGSWALLYRFFGRMGRFDLSLVFLLGDLLLFTVIIYFTGGERSWFFILLVLRCADVSFFQSFRRVMLYAHVSVLCYLALVAYLAFVETHAISWPLELGKAALVYVVNLYLSMTVKTAEMLRGRTATAVRAARAFIPELEAAKREAGAANEAKSAFLANVSHELRTPLSGIIGLTRLALRTPLGGRQQEYLRMMMTASSADTLLQVVNDILDLSKIEARKLELERGPFSLRDLLGETLSAFGVEAREKGLRLEWHVADEVPDRLLGDPLRLRQIVVNLVGNALKFTTRGSVTLRVQLTTLEDTEVGLRIEVEDTGIGISTEEQRRIFEAFSQADDSTSRRYGGSGLGLTICRELAHLMGGRLEVASRPGQGSRFWFTVRFGRQPPVTGVSDEPVSVDARAPAAPPRRPRGGSASAPSEAIKWSGWGASLHPPGPGAPRGGRAGQPGRGDGAAPVLGARGRDSRQRAGGGDGGRARVVRSHPDGRADARARRPAGHGRDPCAGG